MLHKELSPRTFAALVTGVALLLGLAFWWRTLPQDKARAYSEGVARLEQSEAFKKVQAEEAWREQNPEAARMRDQLQSDDAYQPEVNAR